MTLKRTLIVSAFLAIAALPGAAAAADYHISIPAGFAKTGDDAWSQGASTIRVKTSSSGDPGKLVIADMNNAKKNGMTIIAQAIGPGWALYAANKGANGVYEKAVATCHGVAVLSVEYATAGASFPGFLDSLATSFKSAC